MNDSEVGISSMVPTGPIDAGASLGQPLLDDALPPYVSVMSPFMHDFLPTSIKLPRWTSGSEVGLQTHGILCNTMDVSTMNLLDLLFNPAIELEQHLAILAVRVNSNLVLV